ncbi:hypothetical protein ACPV50_05380 [Vibrio astriarenae]
MEKMDIEKLAFCCVLAVIGAVAITKSELYGDAGLNEGIIRWLFFALSCGLVINDQIGRPLKVILTTAAASSITLIAVITFKSYLGKVIKLSGAEISVIENPDIFALIMLALLLVSILGIAVCTYARGMVISLLTKLAEFELEKAEKIEKILNKVVSIGAVAGVILFAII